MTLTHIEKLKMLAKHCGVVSLWAEQTGRARWTFAIGTGMRLYGSTPEEAIDKAWEAEGME